MFPFNNYGVLRGRNEKKNLNKFLNPPVSGVTCCVLHCLIFKNLKSKKNYLKEKKYEKWKSFFFFKSKEGFPK